MTEQGSEEWKAKRLGKVTASRIDAVTAQGRGGAPSATRASYMADLIVERLTGNPTEGFCSLDMQRGNEIEPEARDAYAFYNGVTPELIDFVDHPSIAMSGASPDSYIGDDGLLELKCPKSSTHMATLLGKNIDGGYLKQMYWQMACTGRSWCDFASYDPRMPEHLRLFVKRVHRDDKIIQKLEDDVLEFLLELETKHDALVRLSPADQAKASAILEDVE
jgi:hypothetical protein